MQDHVLLEILSITKIDIHNDFEKYQPKCVQVSK